MLQCFDRSSGLRSSWQWRRGPIILGSGAMVAPGKRGNAVRLTKPVVEMLMKLNDAFEASTYF